MTQELFHCRYFNSLYFIIFHSVLSTDSKTRFRTTILGLIENARKIMMKMEMGISCKKPEVEEQH